MSLSDALAQISWAEHPGGLHAAVAESADLIHSHVQGWLTGPDTTAPPPHDTTEGTA